VNHHQQQKQQQQQQQQQHRSRFHFYQGVCVGLVPKDSRTVTESWCCLKEPKVSSAHIS
jgi:hypothetical protein